jgi:Lycopene cyclase
MEQWQYVWLIWASAFLIPWAGLYIFFPRQRKEMWWASLFTAVFGLSEPFFVPEYWNPPSLFNLARDTGFDIESIIFSFGIGGIGAVLYNVVTRKSARPLAPGEKHKPLHRHHYWAISSLFVSFIALNFLPWNPIYPAIAAMFIGGIANVLCRPDLKTKTWLGGVLFLGFYILFLQGIRISSPGYIEGVWNLEALTGLSLIGMPIEELLFAFGFGMYWSGVYEHFTWRELV